MAKLSRDQRDPVIFVVTTITTYLLSTYNMPDTALIAEEMNMNKLVLMLKEFMIWWGKIVGGLVISGDKC